MRRLLHPPKNLVIAFPVAAPLPPSRLSAIYLSFRNRSLFPPSSFHGSDYGTTCSVATAATAAAAAAAAQGLAALISAHVGVPTRAALSSSSSCWTRSPRSSRPPPLRHARTHAHTHAPKTRAQAPSRACTHTLARLLSDRWVGDQRHFTDQCLGSVK